jgi:microcystin-dependent protein
MATPFLGEIRLFSFGFAPEGWALCNGQVLAINQNQALFAIVGTTYGGNGTTNFSLPNLQGRIPYHVGNGYVQGQESGQEYHTLIAAEMPVHNHLANASSAAGPDQGSPANNLWVAQTSNAYAASGAKAMSPSAIASEGGGQQHENRPPYLTLNFCIALTGIFPSRN